jgi:hypothetical protein
VYVSGKRVWGSGTERVPDRKYRCTTDERIAAIDKF